MKNYIHLNGQDIDLDIINTTQDLDKITDACIRIMGAVLALGTNGIKDDKERVEFVMHQAGWYHIREICEWFGLTNYEFKAYLKIAKEKGLYVKV